MKRAIVVLALCMGALGLLLPWWRNHTLLLDFCDYGLVMAAAGRMNLGEQPYVDFLTPIQTAQFVTALGAERLFGARYLSLTYANAFFIVGAFVGLFLMLKGRLGVIVACLVAGAVVAASAVQHTIIWYNAMGTVWLALAFWGAAQLAGTRRQTGWLLIVIWAALWIGGLTKLTYQVTAIMFVGALTLRSALLDEIPWHTAAVRIGGCVVFGVVAPIATELIWTGATFEQWFENVLAQPARFRVSMLSQLASLRSYLQTPHDYYGAGFDFVGVWGIGLLVLVGALAASRKSGQQAFRGRELALLSVLVVGSWICGGVLLLTNMEISYVSGAAWLVLATGVALAVTAREGEGALSRHRIILGLAAVTLLVPALAAGWKGTRALWGHEPLRRGEFVMADDFPERFHYLKGMRITPTLKTSLREFAEKQDWLHAGGVPPSAFYFVNASEWMVRVVPEARHCGLPLWLAGGTTFSESDAWVIAARMGKGDEMQALFASDAWNYWYPGMKKTIDEKFIETPLGERLFAYVRREPPEPLEFAINTNSNLYSRGMEIEGGPVDLRIAADLFYFGSRNPHRIDFEYGLYQLAGEAIGDLAAEGADLRSAAVMRIYAREAGVLKDLLWEGELELSAGKPIASRTFSVSPGGRPVSLVLLDAKGAPANFGWRKLYTAHAGPLDPIGPWPMNRRLKQQPLGQPELRKLFQAENPAVTEVSAFGGELAVVEAAGAEAVMLRGGSEIWMRIDQQMGHVTGDFGLDEDLWTVASGVRVSVACFKSGRFDVMYRRDLYPKNNDADGQPQRFEVWMPEGIGWIGLLVTPIGASPLDSGGVWWRNVRVY